MSILKALSRRKVIFSLLSFIGLGSVAKWMWPDSGFIASSPQRGGKVILNRFPLDLHWPTQEPFIFCAHHHDFFPKGNEQMGPAASLEGRNIGQDFEAKDGFRMYHGSVVPGFPVHPHRGFETITIVRKGYVDHADSLGAAGRYGQGDVQWMTAGSGVQHSEMFPLLQKDQDNTLELFQIWLNLPKKNKMAPPHFKMLWSEQIPTLDLPNGGGQLTLIAGTYEGVKPPSPPPHSWASEPESDIQIWLLNLKPGAKFDVTQAKPGSTRSLYFFEGSSLKINGESVSAKTGFALDGSKPLQLEVSDGESQVLLLQAKAIGEPVVQYGPFVMNNKAEILQAIRDYEKTQFGGWSWERQDMVHGTEIRRFAKYPDGRTETPESQS